jgi:hypothetical protein
MTSGAYALGSGWKAGKGGTSAEIRAASLMLVSASLSARAQFDAIPPVCRQIARSRQEGINHIGGTSFATVD